MAVDTASRIADSGVFPSTRQTPLPGGYMGKILHVDMTSGQCADLNLPEEPILRKFWGGQSLGNYLLLRLLKPDVDPLGPDAIIAFMTGPMTGTGLTPGGTKMTSV